MATLYSNLYVPAAGRTSPDDGTRIFMGTHGPMTKGGLYVVRGEIVIATGATLGASDSLAKLFVAPEGAMVYRVDIVPSADLDAANTFTFNLGWTSAANTLAAASTGLQAATAFTLDPDAIISAAAAGSGGDELVLTRVAGELSAGTLSFVVSLTT